MDWDDIQRRLALDAQSCLAEVCALIAQEKARPSGKLDLSHFRQLTELPQALAELRHLQDLNISRIKVSDLGPLAALTALQALDCSWTSVSDLGPLAALTALQSLDCSGTPVSDLGPLVGLTALHALDCGFSKVSDLGPLAGLTALRRLVCTGTHVSDLGPLAALTALQTLNCEVTHVSDLGPLAGLTALQSLDCSGTQVSDLVPLAALTALQTLDCTHTQVSDLGSLAGLTALQNLHCSGTHIKTLPPAFPAPQLKALYAYDCELPGIPTEVLSHDYNDDCLPRLRAYLRDLQAGAQSLASAKLMILGNGRVGKTQLLNRLRELAFEENADSTHGVQIQRLTREGKEWHAWDFGGQDIYHSTHALFLRHRAAFIVVWSPDCESGLHIDQYGMQHPNQPLEYWLRYVLSHAGANCPLLIVQTRCETAQQQAACLPVAPELLAQFTHLEILHYSSKTGRKHSSLEDALQEAHAHLLAQHPAQIPSGWLRVARTLCTWREQDYARAKEEKQRRLLTQEAFAGLCAEGGGDVSAEFALLEYLHQSGLVFYQKNLFGGHIILDQAWALDAIYTVFQRDTCYQYLQQAGGRFTRSLLAMLAWSEHTVAEQELFLSMMCSCGIAFEVRAADAEKHIEAEYLAPDLLPPQSAIQTRLDSAWDKDLPYEECKLEYALLQPGLMRTLIAKIGSQAGEDALYWRHGVCVYETQTQAKACIVQESTGLFSGCLVLKTQRDQARLLMQKLLRILNEEKWRWGDQAKFKQLMQGQNMSEAECKPVFGTEPPDQTRTSFAVSYKWEEQSTAIVDQLCNEAQSRGITILRDQDAVRFGQSLSQFMRRLARQDRVFVLLSDAYLKSPNCMFELWKIWCAARHEDDEFMQKVRVYFQPDAKIFTLQDRVAYAIHWKETFQQMDGLLREHGPGILGEKDFGHYRLMQEYALHVSDILASVADRLHPRQWDEFLQYGFDDPPA